MERPANSPHFSSEIPLPTSEPTPIDAFSNHVTGLPNEQSDAADHDVQHDEVAAARKTRSVSFIIPTMDEEESLEKLHAGITEVCEANQLRPQIVFVDDGSTDRSWDVMTRLVAKHASTEAIRFRRNFGKAAALSAGSDACDGEIVFTMDADLQDDPKEIPRFLEKLDEGFDVVSGWKRIRHDPWHKVFPSRVFNWLVSTLTGVKLHDHNCGFKAYRGEIFDEVELYGERHRFIPVLAAARGWKVGEIEVEHHARQFGQSKYGVSRLLKGFLDLLTIYLLTGYSSRPLHLIGAGGMLFFAAGAIGMLYLSAMWVVSRMVASIEVVHLHEKAIFYYCILAVLLGAQFLLAGLLAELVVSRTHGPGDIFSVSQRLPNNEKGQRGGDHE
ncbi:MAG: glycosyltransferase family 2 protein [Rubripirellula sp.]